MNFGYHTSGCFSSKLNLLTLVDSGSISLIIKQDSTKMLKNVEFIKNLYFDDISMTFS